MTFQSEDGGTLDLAEGAHREFLRSIAGGESGWSLLEVPDVSSLPAVEWRMRKLARLDERERSEMVQRVSATNDYLVRGGFSSLRVLAS